MVFGGKPINNNGLNIPLLSLQKLSKPENVKDTILFMFLTMFVVGLLIAGIIYLIKLAQQCLEAKGYYEPFAASSSSLHTPQQLRDRIQKIKELNAILDNSIDTFNTNVQDTCEVYAQVEDIYIGNNSGPNNEEEYNLPQQELDRRLARRKQSAKKRFQEAREIYGESIHTPVYECFATQTSDLEDELMYELEELETKIRSVENGTIGKKGDSLNALLKFNNKYIKKSLQEMGNQKATQLLEGFAAAAQPDLLIRADTAIMKANAIYNNIMNQQSTVKKQGEMVKEITKTVSRIGN